MNVFRKFTAVLPYYSLGGQVGVIVINYNGLFNRSQSCSNSIESSVNISRQYFLHARHTTNRSILCLLLMTFGVLYPTVFAFKFLRR